MRAVERWELDSGGIVELRRAWLAPDEASRLEATLVRELDWEQRQIQLFGRQILQPRLIAWAGELPYRYSGQTLEPRSFTAGLQDLRRRVRDDTGVDFNHALCNRYRDERDSMGFHSDDEPELGQNPVIASVSLGATRRFVLRPKKKRFSGLDLELVHNSLLVMSGTLQHNYRHGVPPARRPVGERINVTFRKLLCAPR